MAGLQGVLHPSLPDARALEASSHCGAASLGWLSVDALQGMGGSGPGLDHDVVSVRF